MVSDALRAGNLGCYGYEKETSPEIDQIAAHGIRFANSYCTINSTDPSFTTIFSGRYPISHGLRNHGEKLTAEEKSYTTNVKLLPEILKEHDFATVGLDWLGKWHKRGYDVYGTEKRTDVLTHSGSKVPGGSTRKNKGGFNVLPGRGDWYYRLPEKARDTIRAMSQWWHEKYKSEFSRKKRPVLSDSAGLTDLAIQHIKRLKDKEHFMIFVHYWDTHVPYTAPHSFVKSLLKNHDYSGEKTAEVVERFPGSGAANLIRKTTRGKTPKTIGEINAYYDASIRYVDQNIGRLYQAVEDLGLLDDTLFVITADHGESIDEHHIYFDHHGLYDPQVKIPLILSHKNLPQGMVYNEFVQHVDIVPTILDLAGINREQLDIDGESLVKLTRAEPWERDFVYVEEHCAQKKRMIRDERYKYIMALDNEKCTYCERYHSQGDEFYDLNVDSGEENNIIDDSAHKRYKKKLEDYISNLGKPKQGQQVEFDDEEEINQRLKALGYI